MRVNTKKIQFGFSVRSDGNMRLGGRGYSSNRQRYFDQLGIPLDRVVSAGLAQGGQVVRVGVSDGGRVIPDCDGLVTDETGIALTVTAADCLPLYFWDKAKDAVGIAHAGWRGLAKNMPAAMVRTMTTEFGTSPADIKAEIGPHIRACHFKVQDDVAEVFADYQNAIVRRECGKFIDLAKIASTQLAAAGIPAANITANLDCVYCEQDKYFSFRRDRPSEVQAMVAYIFIPFPFVGEG
jgi:hypothetical protein